MDNRKNPITSVLDDFRSLSETDQEIVLQTIIQVRRATGTTPAATPKKRTRRAATQTVAVAIPTPASEPAGNLQP